jgi:hypothetical protein
MARSANASIGIGAGTALDFDDVSTKIGKHPTTNGACSYAGEIKNSQVGGLKSRLASCHPFKIAA